MCGIAGSYAWPEWPLDAALDRLAHRGPDGRGVADCGPARHGHVRLALVDLTDASAQPFLHDGGVLSFNGELWNHRELRAELRAAGRVFATTGDTEVLAAALAEWGLAALPKLDGQFAFAWSRGRDHWLVRDRYGETPLYVFRRRGSFAWFSERKAWDGAGGASPLPPGSVLDLATGGLDRWYRLPAGRHPPTGPADALGSLDAGVRKRLDADAPVCCLVSGGLDSSLILGLARRHAPVVAYTAVLDPASPDLAAARFVCREWGVELREVAVDKPGRAALAAAAYAIEIPSKAQVEIAALCLPLARRIAADGFKACLSGEAADELFGGYGGMCIKAAKADDAGWRAIRVGQLEKMARGNFVRCNKAFLSAGVEVRLPFMEPALVEAVLAATKDECPPGKRLLKRMARGVVPASVIRRPKATFQGASGMAAAAARSVPSPTRFYNETIRTRFGRLVEA